MIALFDENHSRAHHFDGWFWVLFRLTELHAAGLEGPELGCADRTIIDCIELACIVEDRFDCIETDFGSGSPPRKTELRA